MACAAREQPTAGPSVHELVPPGDAVFRAALGRFATGVTVVTTAEDEVPHGATANAFTSVSLDPPLILVCLRRGSRTLAAIDRGRAFAVNVLHERQLEVALRFARPKRAVGQDGFHGIRWSWSPHGSPLLSESVAHLDCSLWSAADGGDHVVCIGLVRALRSKPGRQLVFSDGCFARVAACEPVSPVLEAWPWI